MINHFKKGICLFIVIGLIFSMGNPINSKAVDYSTIDFSGIQLNVSVASVAVNHSFQLSLLGKDSYSVEINEQWSSSDDSIASVDANGLVTVHAVANTVEITSTFSYENQVETRTCRIYITNPTLTSNVGMIRPGQTGLVPFTGVGMFSNYSFKSSNPSIVTVYETGNVYALRKGVAVITMNVDGVILKFTYYVVDPKLTTSWLVTVKGKSKKVSVKGNTGLTSTTWRTTNAGVATVSKTGVIKSKKMGDAYVIATVDGMDVVCAVSVTYSKAVKVIKSAQKAIGKKYSQAKRMQKNYYDCSSLVWRMYQPQKVYFGSKNWAPTAAAEAKNMVSNRKVVAYKYVDTSQLLAGDVIFLKGKKNGRYKNIYHTGIYVGNGVIIHAAGVNVCYGYYSLYQKEIAVIARPLK